MTSAFMSSPRVSERVIHLNGHRYLLAQPREGGRDWTEQTVPAQEADPVVEFSLPIGDCSEGAGFTFEGPPGTYDWADEWDASTPGKPSTWPRLTTGESFETEDAHGWLRFHDGYLYMLRGSHAVKYQPSDTAGQELEIQEVHYFGSGVVVAGRPESYKDVLHVPLKNALSGANERFHGLVTVVNSSPEVQTIIISGTPTGGSYTVTYDSRTSAAIAHNGDQSAVQAALRGIPGLELVTVVTTGSTPNFTHTVTMTGVGAPLGSTAIPTMSSTSSLTGGAPNIAHAQVTAGTGDEWQQGPATREFRCFRRYTSNKMYGADGNRLYSVSDDPFTSGDWSPADGSGYEVGDSDSLITDLVVYNNWLAVCKEDGLWTFEEDLTTLNRLPDLQDAPDARNGVGSEYSNGYILVPNKAGLIRWRPGAYRFVGPEMEGALEGETSRGWGRVSGIATYGPTAYYGVSNATDQSAALGSLQPPRRNRGPVIPHIHHEESPASYEGLTLVQTLAQPVTALPPQTFSDDSAVGTITWSNPSNAGAEDGTDATAAAGTSHYLKGLNPGPVLPASAEVVGVKVTIRRLATPTTSATPPSFRDDDDSANTTTKNLVITPPAAATADDALMVFIQSNDSGEDDPTTVPDGWTLRHYNDGSTADLRSWVYTRNPGALPADWTWKWALSRTRRGYIAAFQNVDVNDPWVTGTSREELASTTVVVPTANTPQNACLHVLFGVADVGGTDLWTPPAGYTEQKDSQIGGAGTYTVFLATDDVASSGATGAKTLTFFSARDLWGFSLILRGAQNVVDNIVRLVVGGSVVGDNKASSAFWPSSDADAEYGSSSDLWGTSITAAQAEASDFGVVLSATVGNHVARVDYITMTVYYTVSGNAELNTYVAILRVEEDRATCYPELYSLPHAGLTVANDPTVSKAVAGATLYHSRYYQPQRGVEKTYRVYETWVELDPQEDDLTTIPGFQVWASVDDAAAFQLRDENGDALTVTENGFYQFFFPTTASAIGHYCQIQWRVPPLSEAQVAVAAYPREGILKGAYRPLTTQLIELTLVLGPGEHEDATSMRETARAQLAALEALAGPNSAPVPFRDIVGRQRYAVVAGLAFKEQRFRNEEEAVYTAQVRLRATPYE